MTPPANTTSNKNNRTGSCVVTWALPSNSDQQVCQVEVIDSSCCVCCGQTHHAVSVVVRLIMLCLLWSDSSCCVCVIVVRLIMLCLLWSDSSCCVYCGQTHHAVSIVVRLIMLCLLWSDSSCCVYCGQTHHAVSVVVRLIMLCLCDYQDVNTIPDEVNLADLPSVNEVLRSANFCYLASLQKRQRRRVFLWYRSQRDVHLFCKFGMTFT